MRRADRLFEIIQVLRRAKSPLTAQAIAEKVETGRRTVYRDIAVLIARQVPIRGEAGVGYVLERGFDLPPLMLTPGEIEAVVLGSQWVAENADRELAKAAAGVLGKVASIVPQRLRDLIDHPVVATPTPRGPARDAGVDLAKLREWTRREQKLRIRYADEAGRASARTVWPVLVGYLEGTRALIAWCELRQDFRVFLTNRLVGIDYLEEPYPEPRSLLRKWWLAAKHARSGSRAGPG